MECGRFRGSRSAIRCAPKSAAAGGVIVVVVVGGGGGGGSGGCAAAAAAAVYALAVWPDVFCCLTEAVIASDNYS